MGHERNVRRLRRLRRKQGRLTPAGKSKKYIAATLLAEREGRESILERLLKKRQGLLGRAT